MRSFVAGLAVFLAFLTGTASLAGFVSHHTVLDPSRAGEVVARTLSDRELRTRVLDQAVPGYSTLPAIARAGVDQVAESPSVRTATTRIRLRDDGDVILTPLQRELARLLRSAGLGAVADLIVGHRAVVTVPATYMRVYDRARTASVQVATYAGVATVALAVVALLVSRRRIRTLGSLGIAALLAAGLVALGFWVLPGLVRAVDSDAAYQAVAGAIASQRPDMAALVVPVAVVGLALFVVSLVGRRRRTA